MPLIVQGACQCSISYDGAIAIDCPLVYKVTGHRLFGSGHLATPALHLARILVVDDEEDILLAARPLLKRHFASVDTLNDPTALPDQMHVPARASAAALECLMLEPADFSLGGTGTPAVPSDRELSTLNALERDTIALTLETHGRNINRAADARGLTRASLYRRIQKYGL